MRKTNGAAGKVPKHFETVPLEVVKEIAVEDFPTERKVGAAIAEVRPARKNPLVPAPPRAPAGKKR